MAEQRAITEREVRRLAREGARIVWLPTVDSVNESHEREAPARVERRVGDRLGAERHPCNGHDANARVLPRHAFTGCRVTQVVAGATPVTLEPEPKARGQKKLRTAAATRATEGT